MICKNCGSNTSDNSKFCEKCGAPVEQQQITSETTSGGSAFKKEIKCLPAFILGLIGGIFGMFGGFCMTICSEIYTNGTVVFLLLFVGSIIGLVGACMCLKKALIGSILQLVAGLMFIICLYGYSGGEFMSIFAMLLFLAGGIVGMIFSIIKLNKK